MNNSSQQPGDPALAELAATLRLSQKLQSQARADFQEAAPILADALAHDSGQSRRVAAVINSLWNGDLCEYLCGLDTEIAQALVAVIAARAHLQGDADQLLRPLIPSKGTEGSRAV